MKQAENRSARQVTLHLTLPILVTLTLLTAAFSTGSPVFLMPALLIALLCLSGIYGVFRASATLEVASHASTERVQRGEDVTLNVQVKRRGWIPLAPTWLELSGVNGANSTASGTQMMQLRPGRSQALELTFHAAHVGAIQPGVQSVMLSDFFGVCTIRQKPNMDGGELLVLPQLFDIAPLRLSSGEMGTEAMARASEDVTNPTDVRTYQPGDPMKKIHWKLSARKQEALVRRFEDPVQPDALVLLDCAEPPKQADSEEDADLRDALIETAASVMVQAAKAEHPARLPLPGAHPVELDKDMGLKMLLENLARADFSNPEPFAKVLLLEMRRMRKVGCTVVITARLDRQMVDVMLSMRRMGPNVRLYLVTQTPEDARLMPMILKLQEVGVEVGYVKPLPL